MMRAYGLHGHIRANRTKSVVLLIGFVLLLHALLYSILLLLNAPNGGSLADIVERANAQFVGSWPVAALAACAWFAIAYTFQGAMIRRATRAKGVTRLEAPKLYNALENLCISRGIPMPRLEIMETPALNAYAAGIRDNDYVIAVTRGLIDTLGDQELEAVLAHELTHIRNKDTQLLVIAIIFAGVFAFFGDLFIRRWDFPYGISPRDKREGDQVHQNDSRGDIRTRGEGAALAIMIAIAVIVITWGISTLIRFALSRSREYMADAGAVELTKNPEAMISALRQIEQNPKLEVVSRMEAFFIENPLGNRMSGFLATHPSIDERISALQTYASGTQ